MSAGLLTLLEELTPTRRADEQKPRAPPL